MVIRPSGRRGASQLGCLLAVLLMVVVLYYGLGVGKAYWKYYKFTDEITNTARFGERKTDEELVRHLASVARDLELPAEAQHFVIRRTQTPPTISIRTQYRVTLELPFHNRVVILKPHAEIKFF